MIKWMVVVDFQGERANTLFDDEREAWAFAELLDKGSDFTVHVSKLDLEDDGRLSGDGC